MVGSPYTSMNHQKLIADGRQEELWNELVSRNDEKFIITNGSYTGTGNDQDSNADGLPYNHAFSIMHVLTVTDDTGKEHRLV